MSLQLPPLPYVGPLVIDIVHRLRTRSLQIPCDLLSATHDPQQVLVREAFDISARPVALDELGDLSGIKNE